MERLVEIKNLNYKDMFKNFNMSFSSSKIHAIAGTNNSGKTTLMKMLSNKIDTYKQIYFNNKEINTIDKTEFYSNVGIVLEYDEFLFDKVEDELYFVLDNIKISREDKIRRYEEILDIFNIRSISKSDPNNLSEYNTKKLSLALATIARPSIILIDNILNNFNKVEYKEITSILEYLNKKERITIIYTTNDLNMTIKADCLYILDNYKCIISGNPFEVLEHHDSTLERLGFELPFMVDLSLKLKYYDMCDSIILDKGKLVEELWK